MVENRNGSMVAVCVAAALVLTAVLTGCPSSANGDPPVVTGVTIVAANPEPGRLVAGNPGVLNFHITVEGAGGFPLDLQGPYVEITRAGGNPPPPNVRLEPGFVEAPGEPFPLTLWVNRPMATAYALEVRVRGVPSAALVVTVHPSLLPLVGTVAIEGQALVGRTLEADTSRLEGHGVSSFRWERGMDADFLAIPGATGRTFLVGAEDAGYAIRLSVQRGGYEGEAISLPTLAVTDAGDAALPQTAALAIAGTPEVTELLRVTASGFPGEPIIQWQRAASPTGDFAMIPGASGAEYTVQMADFGHHIRAIATVQGWSGHVHSQPTDMVPVLTVAVQVAALLSGPVPTAPQIINAFADEYLEHQILDFGGAPVEITLRAFPGYIVDLLLPGPGAMFTVRAGVTLTVEDIALAGYDGENYRPTIVIEDGGTVVLADDSWLEGNANLRGAAEGGAVWVGSGGTLVLDGGSIVFNAALYGGGVFVAPGGAMLMRSRSEALEASHIFSNEAIYGGAVFIDRGRLEMWGGYIYFNYGHEGAGGVDSEEGEFLMYGGFFLGNIGGGVVNVGGVLHVHGGQISHNVLDHPFGAGITLMPSDAAPGRTVITDGLLWNNRDAFDVNDGIPGSGGGNLFIAGPAPRAEMGRLGFYSLDGDANPGGWARVSGAIPVGAASPNAAQWLQAYFFTPPASHLVGMAADDIPVAIGRPWVRDGAIEFDRTVVVPDIREAQGDAFRIGTLLGSDLVNIPTHTWFGGAGVGVLAVTGGVGVMEEFPGSPTPPSVGTISAPHFPDTVWPWPTPPGWASASQTGARVSRLSAPDVRSSIPTPPTMRDRDRAPTMRDRELPLNRELPLSNRELPPRRVR